jgi:hypothetical protein
VPTRITETNHEWALSGATERRFCEAPNGDLWVMVHSGNKSARFFRSRDQGATWSLSTSSDLGLSQTSSMLSFHIDSDGAAHVAWTQWDASPQTLRYAYGVPSGSGSGWSWRITVLTPAFGRLNKDADVIAFRHGAIKTVFISWGFLHTGHRMSQLKIDAKNNVSVVSAIIHPGGGVIGSVVGNLTHAGVEFAHNGDGVTALASPHIYLTGASFRDRIDSLPVPISLHRGIFQSGSWTWGQNAVQLEADNPVSRGTIASVWDGSLLCTAWWSDGSGLLGKFCTWNGTATSVTRNDPPALPSAVGTVTGMSISHDPLTDDIFVFAHGSGDGDVYWARLVRSNSTWSSWTKTINRNPVALNNQIQALRHPIRGNIDFVYTDGDLATKATNTLYHSRAIALSRKPSPPALRQPANGALLDLNSNGANFKHSYNVTGPGDKQQAWTFRRRYGTSTITTEWWNQAARTWSTTEFWNAGDSQVTTFPPGFWPAGVTYSWSVRARSATGSDSDYAPERTVVSTSAPVLNVTGPSGLVYGESTPTITWEVISTDAQRDYEVRIVKVGPGILSSDPGPSVWTSGVVTNEVARKRTVDISLDPKVAYRAYVRITSVAGLSSAWDYEEFTLSVDPPSGPLIGVVDELAYPSDIPRARINVTARSNFFGFDQGFGLFGWEPVNNCTVTPKQADLANMVEDSLQITITGTTSFARAVTVPGSPPAVPEGVVQPLGPISFPVVEIGAYTVVVHVRSDVAARGARVGIFWYDDDEIDIGSGLPAGSSFAGAVGDQVILEPGAYTKVTVSATAPVGARLGRPHIDILGAAVGEIYYATRMSFHPGLSTEWQPGGFAQSQVVRVERSTDGGQTWATAVAGVKTDDWQRAIADDRLLPLGREVMYRAFTDADLGTGAILTSGVSPTAVVMVDTPTWVLRDPDDDDGEVFAYVVGHERSDEETAEVHRPAGRKYPVIDSEGEQSPAGTMELYVPKEMHDQTLELLRRTKTLVVQSPVGEVICGRFLTRDVAVEASVNRMITVKYLEVE